MPVDPFPDPDPAIAAARFGAMPGGGFAAGTLLDAPGGPVPVERLRRGDRLTTIGGGSIRLRHAARLRTLGHTGSMEGGVVLLPPDALGPGRPRRTLRLGARQALWLAEPGAGDAVHHALAAATLRCGGAVRWADAAAPPLYYLLAEAVTADGADVVLAEGLACALRPPVRPERDPHAGAALAAARHAQTLAIQTLARSASAPAPPRLDGTVALDSRQRLRGWAMNRAMPGVPVLLEALLDDVTIGFALADEVRPDLAMMGLGVGACGFTLTLAWPPGRRASSAALLRLHIAGTGALLPGTPLLIEPLPGD